VQCPFNAMEAHYDKTIRQRRLNRLEL
jgi:hypothetical protein